MNHPKWTAYAPERSTVERHRRLGRSTPCSALNGPLGGRIPPSWSSATAAGRTVSYPDTNAIDRRHRELERPGSGELSHTGALPERASGHEVPLPRGHDTHAGPGEPRRPVSSDWKHILNALNIHNGDRIEVATR